jgi:adenine phosphoribosyltransferase
VTIDLVRSRIRDVPDFPKPGVLFKDITPLLSDPKAFAAAVGLLEERLVAHEVEAIVGIESRGFIFGAAVAARMQLPLELVRKPGKLPWKTHGVSYDLEYGSDRVEIHIDAIRDGVRYGIVDDLMATGGTASAAAELIELHRGTVACCAFVIELTFLEGRKRLGSRPIESLLTY